MNVLATFKAACAFAKNHRKEIAMVSGAVLTTGAVVYAVIESPEAKKAMDEIVPEKGMTNKELYILKAKSAVPYMWPVALLTTAGLGCFFYANHVSVKEIKNAVKDGMMWKQMYNEAAKVHNDYVNANRKIAGEEIHQKVQEELVDNKEITHPTSMLITSTNKGNEEFYDSVSGQFFYSSATYIANSAIAFAMDMKNGQLANAEGMNGFGTVEEWLEIYLGINAGLAFGSIGWYGEDCEGFRPRCNPFKIYLSDHYITGPDGNPARVIEYDYLPEEP